MRVAALKIEKFMERNGLSDEEFAKQIKVTKHAVRKYRAGKRRAKDPIMIRIKEVTKGWVKESDWVDHGNK